jgi:hypothetical protein
MIYHGGLFLDINDRINNDRVQGGEAVSGQHGVPRGGSHHQEGVDVSHFTKIASTFNLK